MYLPKSKYTGPLYTPEGVYVYEDGTPFKGWFILTYKAEAFEGVNPKEAGKKLVLKVEYDLRNNLDSAISNTLHYLEPSEKDYQKGTLKRYFVKNKVDNSIKEVTRVAYVAAKVPYLERLEIDWNLTGPVADTQIGSYIKEGAATKNQRIVEQAEEKIQGISQYITDYGEYVK
jgi:hypothetical protein